MCIILIILNSAHSSVTENAQESQDLEINSMGSHMRRAEQHYCQAHPLLSAGGFISSHRSSINQFNTSLSKPRASSSLSELDQSLKRWKWLLKWTATQEVILCESTNFTCCDLKVLLRNEINLSPQSMAQFLDFQSPWIWHLYRILTYREGWREMTVQNTLVPI